MMVNTMIKAIRDGLIIIVITVVLLEIGGHIAFPLLFDRAYQQDVIFEFDSERAFKLETLAREDTRFRSAIVHPYVGYTANLPNFDLTHGFHGDFSPEEPPPNNVFSVLLTGGSVAELMGRTELLQYYFDQFFKKNRIPLRTRFFNGAIAGHKQPQQLMTVSYLSTLGAKFDVIVNLDGFNEIVLPYHDNHRRGQVNPFYPRGWNQLMGTLLTQKRKRWLGEMVYLRAEKKKILDRFLDENKLAMSSLYGIYHTMMLVRLQNRIQGLHDSLDEITSKSGDPEKLGPRKFTESSKQDILEASANVWFQASLLMNGISNTVGAEYYHFLQPNQYVKDSKTLSPEELANAYNDRKGYGPIAADGYTILRQKSAQFFEHGINFIDATKIFKDNADTLYIDTCCHLNRTGYQLLSNFIFSQILERSKKLAKLSAPRQKQLDKGNTF